MKVLTPAILILSQGSMAAAERVKRALPGAAIHGLAARTSGSDESFAEFGERIRELFGASRPIIAFCAAGIVIRALAPLLAKKREEPPVLALAEDGSAVVPLLGGLSGVNALARKIAKALGTSAAITTSGEVRFAVALEDPPPGYVLKNPAAAKKFMSDLLAGAAVRLEGAAPWLEATRLPFSPLAALSIRVTAARVEPEPDQLVYHPRSVAAGVVGGTSDLAARVREALAAAPLAPEALAGLFAPEAAIADGAIHQAAAELALPLRFLSLPSAASAAEAARAAAGSSARLAWSAESVALALAEAPLDAAAIGRSRGRLSVVGLGPGGKAWLTPEAKAELELASDLVGYGPYLDMAGPQLPSQRRHAFDNREEEERARLAFELASEGRSVAVVSSGDPGVFAMAAAIMEALERHGNARWHAVELRIIPGISAAQAAAARIGAPLGHDFCILSLSDVLKPWQTIETRLEHAAAADLVIALYNPASRARPWQLERAREILLRHRRPETPTILAREVGRAGETVECATLAGFDAAAVDMRTLVIVGSSKTRRFPRLAGGQWVYTPRRYEG